jgi:hypothetical protein
MGMEAADRKKCLDMVSGMMRVLALDRPPPMTRAHGGRTWGR